MEGYQFIDTWYSLLSCESMSSSLELNVKNLTKNGMCVANTYEYKDISQNANRSFEWRYYFKYSNEYTRNMCHMITCG